MYRTISLALGTSFLASFHDLWKCCPMGECRRGQFPRRCIIFFLKKIQYLMSKITTAVSFHWKHEKGMLFQLSLNYVSREDCSTLCGKNLTEKDDTTRLLEQSEQSKTHRQFTYTPKTGLVEFIWGALTDCHLQLLLWIKSFYFNTMLTFRFHLLLFFKLQGR